MSFINKNGRYAQDLKKFYQKGTEAHKCLLNQMLKFILDVMNIKKSQFLAFVYIWPDHLYSQHIWFDKF